MYKQTPEPSDSLFARKGDEVTLMLTIDENKVPQRLEKQYSGK